MLIQNQLDESQSRLWVKKKTTLRHLCMLYHWDNLMYLKSTYWMLNSVDSDQTAPKEQFDQGLHCLHTHISPNT